MKDSKDPAGIVEFMSLFSRLKDWCGGTPSGLPASAKKDESVRKLCAELWSTANTIESNERRRRELFEAPADPGFPGAWRDYEANYERLVVDIWLADLAFGTGEPSKAPEADLQWDIADADAAEQAGGIEEAIDFAQFNVDQDWRWDAPQEDFIEKVQEGIAAWDRLKQDSGFDLRGAFRRRALIPFVFVPREIATTHGSAETLSMLRNLKQAHDAFIYGATYAALALMRSIMEAVLRDHYGAEGNNLKARIDNARNRLPSGAPEAALHRLRKLANAILHLDRKKNEGIADLDEMRLEKEIIQLLLVLRALIENAPTLRQTKG